MKRATKAKTKAPTSNEAKHPGWQWADIKFMPLQAYAMAMGLAEKVAHGDWASEPGIYGIDDVSGTDRAITWRKHPDDDETEVWKLPAHLDAVMISSFNFGGCDAVAMIPRDPHDWYVGTREDCAEILKAVYARDDQEAAVGHLLAARSRWDD